MSKIIKGLTGHANIFYVEVFPFQLDFDPERFITADNTKYDKDLAEFALIAANASYCKDNKKKTAGDVSGDGITFLEDLGFRDARRFSLTAPEGIDKDDIIDAIVGHAKIEKDGRGYEVIAVGARGSSTASDWFSDVDLGADTPAYYRLTGEHPEWKDKALHKGFAITSYRLLEVLDRYVNDFTDPSASKIILLTGHSRGASVANILGMIYEEREDYKSFAYTFAAATTTTVSAEKAASYRTIFNIVNEYDVVPELPAPGWNGFKRYGIDMPFPGIDYPENYKKLTGYHYQPAIGPEMDRILCELASSREAIYEPDEQGFYVRLGTYRSREKAEAAMAAAEKKMNEKDVAEYFRLGISEKKKNGRTVWELGYVGRMAYLMKLLSQVFAIKSLKDVLNLKIYRFSKKYLEAGMKLAVSVVKGEFVKSHMLPIYHSHITGEILENPRIMIPFGQRIPVLLKHFKLAFMEGAGNVGLAIISLPAKIRRGFGKK